MVSKWGDTNPDGPEGRFSSCFGRWSWPSRPQKLNRRAHERNVLWGSPLPKPLCWPEILAAHSCPDGSVWRGGRLLPEHFSCYAQSSQVHPKHPSLWGEESLGHLGTDSFPDNPKHFRVLVWVCALFTTQPIKVSCYREGHFGHILNLAICGVSSPMHFCIFCFRYMYILI